MSATMKQTRTDVYEIVTDRILNLLSKGMVPWHRPWGSGTQDATPRNLKSGKAYRGVNVFVLNCAGFSSPYWLTFKQAKDMGGMVKKGEKGTPVIFWKRLMVEDKEQAGEKKVIPLLRYYTVFNVEQCDGIQAPAAAARPTGFSPIAAAEEAVKSYANPPAIGHGGMQAYYSPMRDAVTLPAPASFNTPAHYYATLFHELGHSTGHKSRLARDGIVKSDGFGNHLYSKEELVAEMTAAMLCGVTGIDATGLLDNSAAYINSWLRKLQDDRKLVVQAAAQAQKAADMILGVKWDAETDSEAQETAPAAPARRSVRRSFQVEAR
jgi:antirestriction protein ArdC